MNDMGHPISPLTDLAQDVPWVFANGIDGCFQYGEDFLIQAAPLHIRPLPESLMKFLPDFFEGNIRNTIMVPFCITIKYRFLRIFS